MAWGLQACVTRVENPHPLSLGLGSSTLLPPAFPGESDPNIPREEFPLGKNKVHTLQIQNALSIAAQHGLSPPSCWRPVFSNQPVLQSCLPLSIIDTFQLPAND